MTVSVAGSGDHGIVWVEFEADGVVAVTHLNYGQASDDEPVELTERFDTQSSKTPEEDWNGLVQQVLHYANGGS